MYHVKTMHTKKGHKQIITEKGGKQNKNGNDRGWVRPK